MNYCEDWIRDKLRSRLIKYKEKYPKFKIDRVMREVQTWNCKKQRWAPYMEDKDIQRINERRRKRVSCSRAAESMDI